MVQTGNASLRKRKCFGETMRRQLSILLQLTWHSIFTYVFLLDTQFVIYNNSPPRIVFQELKFDLTCPEPCFQSASWQECTRTLTDSDHGWGSGGAPVLSEVVELLSCGEVCERDRTKLTRLSFLNLFTIVNGK